MAIDGDIKFSAFPGSCQIERSKDLTLVNAISYPTKRSNKNSKASKSNKVHKPFSVTCGIDKAAPEVWKHLCHNKKIDEVIVRLWHNDVEGVQVNYMTFTLLDVRVVGCEFIQLHNLMSNAAEMATEAMVEYKFSYTKMILTYDDGSGAVEAEASVSKRRS